MVRMWRARVSLMRAMMEASVVDFPDPVGPVIRTRPAGHAGHPFGDRRQPELFEGRNGGGNHAEGQSHLAPLVEGAATDAGTVMPGQREVDVLVFFENGLLIGLSMLPDDLFDFRPGEGRQHLRALQPPVDPKPRGRS